LKNGQPAEDKEESEPAKDKEEDKRSKEGEPGTKRITCQSRG
jgi:hypothetical protein